MNDIILLNANLLFHGFIVLFIAFIPLLTNDKIGLYFVLFIDFIIMINVALLGDCFLTKWEDQLNKRIIDKYGKSYNWGRSLWTDIPGAVWLATYGPYISALVALYKLGIQV